MKKFVILFSFFYLPLMVSAQISKVGYNKFTWGQTKEVTKEILNCNSKLAGSDFINCDLQSKDSLFLDKYKYQFANVRFFNSQLCEIQFDLKHADLGNVIAEISKKYGNPTIKEKKFSALDEHNHSTGYRWNIGDTEVFIINDGTRMPAICIISSISLKNKYPASTLSLEKLIFE